jgi:hypothetical protein
MDNKYDSKHEEYFEWWLEEAIKAGYVKSYTRCEFYILIPKKSITYKKQLKTKEVEIDRFLLHPVTYQPDYEIVWTTKALNKLTYYIYDINEPNNKLLFSCNYDNKRKEYISVIDIKPDKIFKTASSTMYTFPTNQKLMYHMFDIYVNKIVLYPASNTTRQMNNFLFPTTWTPKKFIEDRTYKVTKPGKFTKGDTMIKYFIKTIDQFKS